MHTLRPGGFALLSLLYAVGAALCAVGALAPASDHSPVPLLWGLAGLGAVGSAVLWLRRDRLGPRTLHAALVLLSLALGLLTWRSATAVGIVGLGPAMSPSRSSAPTSAPGVPPGCTSACCWR